MPVTELLSQSPFEVRESDHSVIVPNFSRQIGEGKGDTGKPNTGVSQCDPALVGQVGKLAEQVPDLTGHFGLAGNPRHPIKSLSDSSGHPPSLEKGKEPPEIQIALEGNHSFGFGIDLGNHPIQLKKAGMTKLAVKVREVQLISREVNQAGNISNGRKPRIDPKTAIIQS